MGKLCVVGLTGPTGAGKSTVVECWKADGFAVIDTDRLAREAVIPGSECLRALTEVFSAAILNPDGTLNRHALAAAAFADPEKTAHLNAITHPAIIALANRQLADEERRGTAVAVIDAPLLFESGMDALCALTVAVLAPEKVRLARIMQRDGISEELAAARMNAQPNDAFYITRSTRVLRNDAGRKELETAARAAAWDIMRWNGEK